MSKRLRLTQAAAHLGVHPITMRRWADEGCVRFVRVGRERRFELADLDNFLGVPPPAANVRPRVEALYVRVSGSAGQGGSLAAQEVELQESATSGQVRVFKDKASGLTARRPRPCRRR